MGMSVLYARQLLTTLLSEWPSTGHHISADLIGCKDSASVPFVLDLLNTPEAKGAFHKVVKNLIKHSECDALVPIALTCSHFMEEAELSTISRESEHNYRDNTDVSDKVHIPGAKCLHVEFDSRLVTAAPTWLCGSQNFSEQWKALGGADITVAPL